MQQSWYQSANSAAEMAYCKQESSAIQKLTFNHVTTVNALEVSNI